MYIFVGMLIVFIAGFLYLSRNKEKVDNSIADKRLETGLARR